MELMTIGRIQTGMNEKFGLPRQSGLAMGLKGSIVFEKDYALPEAFDGLIFEGEGRPDGGEA